MAEEKTYEEVTEAKEIVNKLCEDYAHELWAVRPDTVITLGVTNKERPKSSSKLASIRPLNGATKALMQIHNVGVRYLIELYWEDWNQWSEAQKTAVIFHELIHIAPDIGKTVKHDVEDFRIMVDKLGVNWFNDPKLPHLLREKVAFDLALRPNVPKDAEPTVGTEPDENAVKDDAEFETEIVTQDNETLSDDAADGVDDTVDETDIF